MCRTSGHTQERWRASSAHYRRRRTGSVRRRSTVRRVGGGGRSANGWVLALGAVVAFVLLRAVIDFVRRHPYWTALLVSLVVAGAVVVVLLVSKQRARERADQAQRDRLIAVTDAMSGPEFEQWFARLLVVSGFRDVTVCGGSATGEPTSWRWLPTADASWCSASGRASTTGWTAPLSVRRHLPGDPWRRDLHARDEQLLHGDGIPMARQLDITLVDRPALEIWAWTGDLG